MLADSNIIIYASKPEHLQLRRFIADHAPAVSAISYVEVLGYPQIGNDDRQFLEELFRVAIVLPISPI